MSNDKKILCQKATESLLKPFPIFSKKVNTMHLKMQKKKTFGLAIGMNFPRMY